MFTKFINIIQLRLARVRLIKSECFSNEVVALAAKNEAHSDDEMGQVNGKTIYHVKRKEGHSEKVGKFFDMVDEVRFAVAQRRGPQFK
jgi:hypothetical protein